MTTPKKPAKQLRDLRGKIDAGIYVLRGRGLRRYVGEAVSYAERRQPEIAMRIARLIKRMPYSTKEERLREEARVSRLYQLKGFDVVNRWSHENLPHELREEPTPEWAKGIQAYWRLGRCCAPTPTGPCGHPAGKGTGHEGRGSVLPALKEDLRQGDR